MRCVSDACSCDGGGKRRRCVLSQVRTTSKPSPDGAACPCAEWTGGARPRAYGRRWTPARLVAYVCGALDPRTMDAMVWVRRCDNAACVEPEHHVAVPRIDNVAGSAAERVRATDAERARMAELVAAHARVVATLHAAGITDVPILSPDILHAAATGHRRPPPPPPVVVAAVAAQHSRGVAAPLW